MFFYTLLHSILMPVGLSLTMSIREEMVMWNKITLLKEALASESKKNENNLLYDTAIIRLLAKNLVPNNFINYIMKM